MSGELILVLFLIRHFSRNLPESSGVKNWVKEIQLAMYGVIALLLIEVFFIPREIANWIDHIVLFAFVITVYLLPGLQSLRNFLFAVFVFACLAVTKDLLELSSSTYAQSLANYFDVIVPCAFVWMIWMFVVSNKQRKALQKEREQRQLEEEQNKIMAARKAELETMVNERTSALLSQKEELEHALAELQQTQAQLIQKEKMASLGELTAGIAHEIQNPLNFVNNFSELNKELLDELEAEISSGNIEEVKALASDIRENEAKIHQHGKRADAIVKGMLQHSRASSGTKEPTDINALADEYLRLSYHGLRAKDKSFNATFKTDFDENIGKLNIVPQEIGRVLLNLINNAFYAVTDKKKQQPQGYEPTVLVCTKLLNRGGEKRVIVQVRDNGMGVSPAVLDKIYQPFFTTKPAGQGTGLGLSLSYEIIKAHGGELKLDTKEGAYAEFTIELPVNGDRIE